MHIKEFIKREQLYIIPFGGCGEFGMNMTAYLLDRKLYIVDAGVLFPDARKLGVASIIPAAHDLIAALGGVKAYFITHGHEDHIGALPFLFGQWPAPIYASPWTTLLIKRKFLEHELDERMIHTVKVGDRVRKPRFEVRFVHVNHSIPDACAFYIKTPEARVFHTGDFKIDPQPVGTPMINLKEIEAIGQEGVDLLIADSTNAQSPGPSPSESSVIEPLERHIKEAKGRVFITTFASNLWRLKVIAEICQRQRKKLLVLGRGMANCFAQAEEIGFYNPPAGLFIEESQLSSTPAHKLVVLASGSQAEHRSALPRIAAGEHRSLKIVPGDLILFSARMIPGNERPIFGLLDMLRRQGARIITTKDDPGIHVSGHAYAEDLKTMLRLLSPHHYLPVHGTFSHLLANVELGEGLDYTEEKSTLIENGDIIEIKGSSTRTVGRVELDYHFIDQDAQTPMVWETLRERLRIGELGVAILTGVFSEKRRAFVSGPDILLQGLTPPGADPEDWHADARAFVEAELKRWLEDNQPEAERLTEHARTLLRRFLTETFHKKPVVIAKIYMV